MGNSRFSSVDWDDYATKSSYHSKTREEIFTSTGIDAALDPKNIKIRESVDSPANPESTPIIVGLDETGSMGSLAEQMIRKGLPVLINSVYDRKPVKDPHVLCMGLGDAECDRAPLQVTQFEAAAVPLITQVEKIYLEGNGGGNSYESYSLAWHFAATRTKIDSFDKRGKKGYLFTVGDEPPPPALFKTSLKEIYGEDVIQPKQLSLNELLTMVSKQWEVYHIIVAQGSYCRSAGVATVRKAWQEVLGQRVIVLEDSEKMAEVIVSTIQVAEGADHAAVAASWDGSTAVTVAKAIKTVTKNSKGTSSGVVSL